MNKILIVDASESDRRLMSGLLTRAGYEPIAVDTMEAAKEEVAKLPPGAVVVTAMKFAHGTAQELVNWQKREGYKFPAFHTADDAITASNLNFSQSEQEPDTSLRLQEPEREKAKIIAAMRQAEGNKSQAARLLGIGRSTLDYKLRQYGIKKY